MAEADIIHQVRKKNRVAQKALYDKYKRLWYSICLRYNAETSDAEDVLQNALVKIFTNVSKFDPAKGTFKSWSSKVVLNENLQYLRKKNKRFDFDQIDDDLQVMDVSETPLEYLSAKELTQLINQLPNGYKVVFNMYVIDGYTHQEISDALSISVGTSKSQLFKARKLLQQKLELLL